ncbi:hypothetical protein AVEN_28296-1 [Araneus ventricosus]|uniref:Uncharacterized protein n=1 Tax=Araneus ventricosus TaxID=182803 RepID=A0A4Y2PH83_ARAVE|nr:hypothetical protein AVEN_28296-1 [Araneus ventricosus]
MLAFSAAALGLANPFENTRYILDIRRGDGSTPAISAFVNYAQLNSNNSLVLLIVAPLLIELSLCIPWYKDVGQGDMLDSLNSPYLSATYDSFYGERERMPKSISKRSADWSNKRSSSSVAPSKLLPEPQEIENIEMTTKLPRVIRKVRLQNVPQQFKRFDQNGIPVDQRNGTITSDKRGRIVRVRKFRKRTTTATPVVSTTTTKSVLSTTTATRPTTTRPKNSRPINFVRQTTSRPSKSTSNYSHITVINKEYVHQKPNRKNKNKNMNRIWVPTSTFGSRSVQKESNDVTSQPYPTESEIKKQRSESTFDDYQSKRFGAYALSPDSNQRSRSNRQITNPDDGSKLENERLNEPLNTRRTVSENKQKSHRQASVRHSYPAVITQEMKEMNSHQTNNPNSVSDTTPMPAVPKSFEILKDDLPDKNNPVSLNIPQSSSKTNDSQINSGIPEDARLSFGTEIPSQPQTNSQTEQRFPETQFGRFPPQDSSIFQGYPYENINPYFRSPQPQIPGTPPIQTSNPLTPTNFRQPFTPFNRQNDPQFQDYFSSPFQPAPYHRREGLARPDFYQSPQLASLRRSIIEEAYSEEEVTEPTTEFSIPKFEIPSIDFNDKGCRTVYKEVRAVPSDEPNEGTQESNAKSFVMTRECYFPDGVPTVKPVSEKESAENVTSPTKEI